MAIFDFLENRGHHSYRQLPLWSCLCLPLRDAQSRHASLQLLTDLYLLVYRHLACWAFLVSQVGLWSILHAHPLCLPSCPKSFSSQVTGYPQLGDGMSMGISDTRWKTKDFLSPRSYSLVPLCLLHIIYTMIPCLPSGKSSQVTTTTSLSHFCYKSQTSKHGLSVWLQHFQATCNVLDKYRMTKIE